MTPRARRARHTALLEVAAVESWTLEIAVAEDDPYDRTLGLMVKCGPTIILARSLRVKPDARFGEILYQVDRLALAWAVPELHHTSSEHLHDVWDDVENRIGFLGADAGPF